MIPKRMIFVWLGSEMPDYGQFCIESFKKANPSFDTLVMYEPNLEDIQNVDLKECIKSINSSNDNFYKRMMYRNFSRHNLNNTFHGKMTALSDAFRFYLLNKYGGIYLDLDTFPVKPFDDRLMSYNGFIVSPKQGSKDIFFIGLQKGCIDNSIGIMLDKAQAFDDKISYMINENVIHAIPYPEIVIKALYKRKKTLINKFLNGTLAFGESLLSKRFTIDYYIDHFRLNTWRPSSAIGKELAKSKILSDNIPVLRNFTHFNNLNNYGQRLQCFALQQHIKDKFGLELKTYCDRKHFIADGQYFHDFEQKHMMLVDSKLYDAEKPYISKIIIGGDQVLNVPNEHSYAYKPLKNILKNAPNNRCFFYSAGLYDSHVICNSVLAMAKDKVFSFGLRESCSAIVHEKNIDPVFLLNGQWEKYMAPVEDVGLYDLVYRVQNGKCILLEQLLKDSRCIKHIDGETGFKTPPDPCQFLSLVKNCSSIKTNSFHGVAFALMFGIKKIICENPDDHRIRNILDMLGVEVLHNGEISCQDTVQQKIQEEIVKADNYLYRCLNYDGRQFCCYSKDIDVRDRSTSGGFCAEAAKAVLSYGGVVYGAAFSDDFKKVVTRCVDNMEDYFTHLSKSKYNFCYMPKLKEVKKKLDIGQYILYIGVPCQIRSLKKFLKKDYSNLLTIDFKCNGYSKPSKLACLVEEIEHKHKSKISKIDFRPQHRVDGIEIVLIDGQKVIVPKDVYHSFIFDRIRRCDSCTMNHGGLSKADITVGDFWDNRGGKMKLDKNFTPEAGCNKVIVNTSKGAQFFDQIKHYINVLDISTKV